MDALVGARADFASGVVDCYTPIKGGNDGTHPILLSPKPLLIASRHFVHRIRIPQVGSGFVVAPRRHGILVNAPAVPEGVGELVDGEDEFAFGGAAAFHA